MSRSALARMTDPSSEDAPRRRYEAALIRAMAVAERHLPRDQALEIAHDVASEMMDLPPERVTGALIYVAVTSGMRSFWRSTQRRAAREGAYQAMRSRTPSVWADPAAAVELGELRARIDACVAAMPPAMRQTYILVREEELTYKEAAARLGVSMATVHTQIIRAGVLLRQCVTRYHADAPHHMASQRRPKS